MKYAELTKSQQNKVFTEIAKEYMQNGETLANAVKCTKVHIEGIDEYCNGNGGFKLVDYSSDEDGTDIRVEWQSKGVKQMRDVYLMNKETGELIPSEKVFKEFYKTHGIKNSVFDEWKETDIEVENSSVEFPDFSKAIRI